VGLTRTEIAEQSGEAPLNGSHDRVQENAAHAGCDAKRRMRFIVGSCSPAQRRDGANPISVCRIFGSGFRRYTLIQPISGMKPKKRAAIIIDGHVSKYFARPDFFLSS
jgi:hypothetical protein